jgi:DNA polymerase III delta prime subunit
MKLFKDIVGQDRAKKALEDWYNFESQPALIYGSSGYGKTTFAISLRSYNSRYYET